MGRKRTCHGCRALYEITLSGRGHQCDLGWPIEDRPKRNPHIKMAFYEPIPLTDCPKPRTWKQWLNAPHAKKAMKGK